MFEREGHIASLYEDARERKALDWVVAHAVISEEK
jgi:hypothetical protein